MYLLYIDETGTTKLKKDCEPSPDGDNSLYFVLGASLIRARELENIESKFDIIKNTFFKDRLTEIKYSRSAKLFKNETGTTDYRKTVFECISQSAHTLFGVGLNKYKCYEAEVIKSKDDTYLMAFQHFISLINGYMYRSKIKESITVFIDSVDRAHDTKIYYAYKEALKNDSLFPNFDKSIFSPSLNFADSKFTVGLQIADVVSGALWRALEKKDKTYSQMIKKKFPSSDNGNPLGYGYKICEEWLFK